MRRVVVTGIGVLSSIGNTVTRFEESLRAGRSGIGPITQVDTSRLRFHNAAEIQGFEPAEHFSELTWLDRFAQLGIVAARDAIADSALRWNDELRARTGVITGSCLGGMGTEDDFYFNLYHENKSRLSPAAIPRIMSNAVASHVAMEQKFTGATFTTSTACSSANHAIGQAFWLIRQGTLDCALAGGSEAPIVPGHLKAWEGMRVVAPDTCRPFSKNRAGLILGEGAAMLVLETLEQARARGAKIYAELADFGMSADAHHLTNPLPEGAARAMSDALYDAGLSREQINYVNAHGTGTPVNDSTETRALRQVLPPTRTTLPSVPPNPCTGTRSAQQEPWKRRPPSSPYAAISSRPPRIFLSTIPPVTLMSFQTKRGPRKSKPRFRTRSLSAA